MSNFQANLRAIFNTTQRFGKVVTQLNKRVMDNAKGESASRSLPRLQPQGQAAVHQLQPQPPVLMSERHNPATRVGMLRAGDVPEIPSIEAGREHPAGTTFVLHRRARGAGQMMCPSVCSGWKGGSRTARHAG